MDEHEYLAECFRRKVEEWISKLAQARSAQNWAQVEMLQRELEGYQEQESKMRAEANRRRIG
jgi:hypothetical protein